jgi:hypothetical protein
MRRKILQSFANNICHMLVGWRMHDDLEIIGNLPNGELSVNVIEGAAKHDQAGSLDLYIAKELQAWFLQELTTSGIPAEKIVSAEVKASVRTDRVDNKHKKVLAFVFEITSRIKTDERAYVGSLNETHEWHQMPQKALPAYHKQ